MSLKGKRLSLADKISSLITAAPTNFNSDDEYDDTTAKLVERDVDHEDDSGPEETRVSKFRTQNLDLLDDIDKRYEGKKVSRKTLEKDIPSSESGGDSETDDSNDAEKDAEDSEEDENSKENEDADISDASGDNSDESEDNNETETDDEPELETDEANPLRRKAKTSQDSNFRHMSATDFGAEIEKGKCVRSQLGIWENLLEMRIKLQKCLVSSNKMPQFDIHKDLKADKNFTKSTNESKNSVAKLLDNLLELQSTLLKNYPETKQLAKNNGQVKKPNEDDMDEEIPSDTEDEAVDENEEERGGQESEEGNEEEEEAETVPRKKRKLKDYESLLSKNHNLYSSYRNSVIQKWNDKTRVAVGNVNNKGSTQPVVKQIEYILSDKPKLRKRTQLKRSEYEIVGKQGSTEEDKDGRRVQEYDSEIYDDDDFYHQLLRELIEFKSADVTDPIQLSKQWIQLQNMRSKMKRKIDTKATKGRRIRFGVHSKLVNFMAPIATDDLWSDEAKTELYNSLFGKIKEVEQK